MKRLGPALGVVGLLNVQLAIADRTVYVLEANPRASRTVPFASKAIGVNLVDAACRLAAGATLADLDLPAPRPTQVSVKAAVLPFSRFPGADPVLGPRDALDRRGDGERRRPPDRARQGRARRRPAAADLGTAFLSVRDEDKPAASCRSRRARRARLRPRRDGGHGAHAARGGLEVEESRRSPTRRRASRPSSISSARPLRPRREHAAGERRAGGRLPDPRGGARRAGPVHHDDLRARRRRCTRSRTPAPSRRSRSRSGSGSETWRVRRGS